MAYGCRITSSDHEYVQMAEHAAITTLDTFSRNVLVDLIPSCLSNVCIFIAASPDLLSGSF